MIEQHIGFILLAAGNSSRMGKPKQLLKHGDTTFLGHALREMERAGWPIVVVVGKDAELLEPIIAKMGADWVMNPEWEEGMASSIRYGLKRLIEKHAVDAVVIVACDQPAVTAEIFHALAMRRLLSGASMVASTYDGTRGIPALFDQSCFSALLNLRGKNGAKSLLSEHPGQCAEIEFKQGETDIDSPEDYAAWLQQNYR